jgi:hypothetical protein
MQHHFSFILAALALVLLLQSSGAQAAEATSPAAASSACGSSSLDAIASAQAALEQKNAEGQTRAISCLIAAVAALEDELQAFHQGKHKSGVLAVPIHSDRNQRGP